MATWPILKIGDSWHAQVRRAGHKDSKHETAVASQTYSLSAETLPPSPTSSGAIGICQDE